MKMPWWGCLILVITSPIWVLAAIAALVLAVTFLVACLIVFLVVVWLAGIFG